MADRGHCNVCGYAFGFMGSGVGGECVLCGWVACWKHFLKSKKVCKACAVKHDIKE